MTNLTSRQIRCSLMLVSAIAVAGTATASPAIAIAEVEPGMRGVCVTEMDGGERVEFPVTVLGTIGSGGPERELVLIRLEDERFRHTGVIGGMSGSPVYVDGRLLGAVAYGWAFSKDPIAGVQPFEYMSGVKPDPLATTTGAVPAAMGGGIATGARPSVAALAAAVHTGGLDRMVVDWLLPVAAATPQRLPLVVGAGGFDQAAGWIREGFERLGWVGVPGGASDAGDGGIDGALEPGGMVAAVLIDGDATLAVGGTVTEVRGDDVWAFGHTVFGAGRLAVPLARARVVAVLPSQMQSFKFFAVGETIGSFEADRYHGSWGRLGASVDLLPVAVEVDGRSYHFRSVHHDVLTPLLVAYLAQTTYTTRGRTFGGQTVALELGLDYADQSRVEMRQVFAGGDAAAQAAAYAAAVVAYLETSMFEGPPLTALAVRMDSREALVESEIVDAVPERWQVAPGERLGVRVRLRAHGGAERVARLELSIPARVPDGRLDLVVADGASWSAYDLRMRPPRSATFADELRLLDRLEPSSRLVAALERPEPGVVMGGSPVSAPAGVVLQLRAGLGPNLAATAWSVVARASADTDQPVAGAVRITLEVDASSATAGR